ncbi:MAG: thiolase domain-containing protein [Anaerolineae bacterium]|nr:thiolase domain-containing protein [Anaerolineae bacterium]
MRDVCVIGIGQTPIGELWDMSLRDLAAKALRDAMKDAGLDGPPEALFVANMLAPRLSNQAHLGALIADFTGWRGIEAVTVEAACASGGAAFQQAYRAVASGLMDVVAVCGVEKMTDATTSPVTSALATAADADFEGAHGASFVALNALVMQRYMYEYRVPHESFAPFSINAHQNAINNPNAMFRRAINEQIYKNAPVIADPINLYDSSPICDGAAAMVLCPLEMARELNQHVPVRVLASVTATDCLDLAGRHDLLGLEAARGSAKKAYEKSGLSPQDIDVFEVHDAFSIMAALSLEAAGFAERGKGTSLALDGEITPQGKVPISTMGGLKGRGHPVGATGVYELVDVVTQLRGEAAANQVPNAEVGMSQNIGGTGATVVTHILQRLS